MVARLFADARGPLLGALLGWLGARWLGIADPLVGSSLGALLLMGIWSALTGMRQENGVLSTIGIPTLVFLLLIRWQALTRLPSDPARELAACLALARGAAAAIAYTTRPADDASNRKVTLPGAASAVAAAVALAFLPGLKLGLVLAGAALFAAALLRSWMSSRLGGADEAALHAASFAIETWLIVLAGCRNCPWWS